MSEGEQRPLRPARQFEAQPPVSAPTPQLDGRREFDADQAVRQAAETATVDAALAAPPKRRGLLLLAAAAALLATVELVDAIVTAVASGAWLQLGWPLLGLAGLALALKTLGRELWRLRHLRRHGELRDEVERLRASPALGGSTALCDALRKEAGIPRDDLRWQGFVRGDQPYHTDRERLQRYSHHLLADRDREARRLVTRAATDVALVVAVSPLAWVDMAMMAWRTVRLLDRLAALYGLQLGYAARIRLFRTLLLNLAVTGMGELATDAAGDLVALGVAGRVSTRLAQGLAAGLLTARLGLRAAALCRPLPYRSDEIPRLAELRSELLTQLRTLAAAGKAEAAAETMRR